MCVWWGEDLADWSLGILVHPSKAACHEGGGAAQLGRGRTAKGEADGAQAQLC